MGDVEDLAVRRAAKARGLVERVVFALVELGGSAHRDVIAARVNVHLSAGNGRPSDALVQQIEQTLIAFEHGGAGRRGRRLFSRVFGPGTHRWTLTADGVSHGDRAAIRQVLVAAEG